MKNHALRMSVLNHRDWRATDIAGCVLWLRADRGVTLSSSNVTTWADQSSSHNNVSQASASLQPTIATNVQNGRPGILFDNSNDQLTMATASQLNWERTQAWTMLITAKLTATASDDTMISKGNPLSGGFGMQIAGSGTLRVNEASSGSDRMVVGSTMTTDNTTAIYEATYNGGSNASSSVSVWQNGTSKATSATVNSLSASILNASKVTIGGQDGGTTGAFGGYIFEVLIYSRVLATAERVRLEYYLRQKYAL